MNLKRYFLFLLPIVMVVIFTNMIIGVNAMNTGFTVEELTDAEQNNFVANIELTLLTVEPVKKAVKCFDVNSNHLIAIGQNASDRKTICVYSNEGVFQYGYIFNCTGDFGVEWDGEDLNIYFVRSSVIVSVSSTGKILDVFEVQNTIENNAYVNHFVHATARTIGDSEYYIGNNIGILNLFAPLYSQIVVKDVTGTESVIYDVSSIQLSNMLVATVIVCVFVAIAIIVICQAIKKIIKDQSGETNQGKPIRGRFCD